jgi:hypothetical protein
MAILIMGSAQCALCGQMLDDTGDQVAFPWFDAADPELARFSSKGAHYRCVRESPHFPALVRIFLNSVGPDGTRPNGNVVFTGNDDTRAVWLRRWGMLHVVDGPLLLLMEAPLRSLERMSFFTQPTELMDPPLGSEDLGIGVGVDAGESELRLTVELCGATFRPSVAPPGTVRRLSRSTRREEVDRWRRGVYCVISRVADLTGHQP